MKLVLIWFYLVSSRLAGVGPSLPCEFESSENGGPDDTNSVPPCESLTIEKHVFESSADKPKLCVAFPLPPPTPPFNSRADDDLLLFSLLSFVKMVVVFLRCFFFCSLLDIGTHLYIFIVVSPIVTHFFSLENAKKKKKHQRKKLSLESSIKSKKIMLK